MECCAAVEPLARSHPRRRSSASSSVAESCRADHYLGLRVPPGEAERMKGRLAPEPVFVSVRGDAMRITPHLYNDDADRDRLLAVLKAAR